MTLHTKCEAGHDGLPRITITREGEDRTHMERWILDFLGGEFIVDHYATKTRPSTRHKYRAVLAYNRLDNRGSQVTREDVPLPFDVAARVNLAAANYFKTIPVSRGGK